MKKSFWLVSLVMIVAVTLSLSSCAGMQAKSTEQLLSASGFQMKMAATPQQQTHLQSLTQRKLVPHERNGKMYYTYANAKTGQLYVGNAQSYQRYQELAVEKNIAREQREAAEMNMDAAMDWDLWGPWDPMW